jgi:hypothetical protein
MGLSENPYTAGPIGVPDWLSAEANLCTGARVAHNPASSLSLGLHQSVGAGTRLAVRVRNRIQSWTRRHRAGTGSYYSSLPQMQAQLNLTIVLLPCAERDTAYGEYDEGFPNGLLLHGIRCLGRSPPHDRSRGVCAPLCAP